MAIRTISTRMAIEGEAKYKQSIASCNAELKTLKSSLALVDSSFKGNANSMEALTAKGKALADMQAAQAAKISELENALKNAQDHQKAYADAAEEAGKKVSEYQSSLEKLKQSSDDTQKEQAELTAEIEKWKKVQAEAEQANYSAVKGVQNWQQQLNKAKIEQNDLKEAVRQNNQYLDEAASSADGCATSIDEYGKAVEASAASTKEAVEGEKAYKQSVSNCDSELKTLKSSLALVESQYRGNANSVEALMVKGEALTDIQAKQAEKVQTLGEALQNAQEHQKKYSDAAAEAGQKVAECKDSLEKLKQSTGDTMEEQAALTAEIKKWQQAQTEAEESTEAAAQSVQEWQQRLNSAKVEQGDLAEATQKNNQYLEEAEKSADGCAKSIDKYGKEVDAAEENTRSFADALKDGLVTGAKAAGAAIAAVGTAAVAGVKFLNDIAESTEEYRAAQGKLNTAFEAAGFSTGTAKEAYQTLYAVLGDTDNATESAQLLAQLATAEEDVAKWGDIAAGVTGTFGDALPINSLIEASNETAKVGEVTGALADALNWVGISEDEFNSKLSACADETERTALITDTLTETYQNATDIFKENNATVLEANKAQAELDDTMARLGGRVAEVKTALTAEFAPALADVVDAFVGLTEGADGAEEALAEAIDGLIGQAAEKLPELLEFGTEIILNVLNGLAEASPQLAEGAVTVVTSLAEGLIEALPQLAEAGAQLIAGLVEGLAEALPDLLPAGAEAVTQLVQALVDNVPLLADAALELVTGLADGILDAAPTLLEALPELIESIVSTLLEAVPEITEAGVELLSALVEDLPEIIDSIVEVLPEIIESVIDTLLEQLPDLAEAGVELLTALVTDLPEISATIAEGLTELLGAIKDKLVDSIPEMVETGVELLTSLIDDLPQIIWEICQALPEIIDGMIGVLEEGVDLFEDVGGALVEGLWNGIQSLAGWLWDKVSGWISGIWDGVLDFFGINSPSKQMAWVGEMLVEGLAGAVSTKGQKAVDAVGKMTGDMLSRVEDEKDVLVSAYKNIAQAAADGVEEALPSKVLTTSLEESRAACQELMTTLAGERYAVASSTAALRTLVDVENRSAAQKDAMAKKAAELNKAVPDLGLAYDATTDSINMTTEALEKLIDQAEDQKLYEARVERLGELYTEQEQLSLELEAAREALSEAEAEGSEGVQVLQESIEALTGAQSENAAQIAELEAATADYGESQAEAAAKAQAMTERITTLTEEVDKLHTSYEDIRKKAEDSMESQLGLFNELDGSAQTSIDSLIETLRGQVEYMRVYAENIRLAMELGVDKGLVQKLSDGRQESAQILAAIVQGGQQQIDALNDQFARVELGKGYFAKTVADMEIDFKEKMDALVSDLNDAINEMDLHDEAYTIGMNNVLGLLNGADSQRDELVDQYAQMGKDALAAYKREVGQASPSKKFRQAGRYNIQGIIQGVESEKARLEAAYTEAAQAALHSMERAMPSTFLEPRNPSPAEQTAAIAAAVRQTADNRPVIQLNIDHMEVRSDADIDNVTQKLYYMVARETRGRGGVL